MTILKAILTILNIFMAFMFLISARDFKWENKADHSSIIGFSFMVMLHMVSSFSFWI